MKILRCFFRFENGKVRGEGSIERIAQLFFPVMPFHLSGNELRRRIHRLRCRGLPIAANRDGYFYAQTAGELYATIRQLEKLRKGVEAAIRGLEAAMDKYGAAEDSR